MSGGSGGSRVPIPNNVRNTINHIREITGKQHTDDEIYAVLKECSMDPNETAQKLLYLDTFHEVRRRRDRKKEGSSNRVSEESRSRQHGQGRGARGASGGYSSNFFDGGGGRNFANRRENGVHHIAERTNASYTQSDLQKTTNPPPQASRVSAVAPHSAANPSNGESGHGSSSQSLKGSVVSVPKTSSPANDTVNQENIQPLAVVAVAVAATTSPSETIGSITQTDQGKSSSSDQGKSLSSSDQHQIPVSGVYSSSSDSVPAPSITQNPGVGGAISREVGNDWISAGPSHVQGNKLEEDGDLSASKNEKSRSMGSTSNLNAIQRSNEIESNQLSEPLPLSSSLSLNSSLRPPQDVSKTANVTEVSASEAHVQSTELRQHVTFPNHFQVPKAFKSGLTFGSFDTFGPTERSYSVTGCDDSTSPTPETSPENDEAVTSSNQSAPLTEHNQSAPLTEHNQSAPLTEHNQSAPLTEHEGHVDYAHSSSYLVKTTLASERISITDNDSKIEQPKQEVLLTPEGHPILTVQSAQNYGLNLMSTMLGTQQVQFDGSELQAQETSHLPSFVTASSQAVSPSPTPPLQSNIPVSPQAVSYFRPPYPANFFPYGPYYPPIYVSPMHQFLSHNGFPQQPSAGNMYLPAATAAAGIKFPQPQFKAGANTGNMAHIGIPSGSLLSPPVGYAPAPTVNTGSSGGNENLAVSQLKENQIYTTGQLSEGSAVWIHAPGQDISSLQLNSLYNLAHQGQHLSFPLTQAAPRAFPGIYQPGQSVASPSTLLQQSQAVAGPVESVGLPPGSYQQPPPSQINWNSNF